ncbi:hypothetical protein [Micromonospora sp. WMMD714]|uniref:hypothetical protein n=1 Tax=Micromonospora sp. WMMD714 TaxID=3016097 RepID=UPI00249B0765|nr:hypothetical protein [Micromonospora sp. WMMD714]WFE62588.1 hypothetical protein O7625_04480 [Micromonospora sp. WMMD714]
MTAANLGALLSPLAAATTVGGISWTAKSPMIKHGLLRVDTDIMALAPCRIRMMVNELEPSEPKLQYLVGDGRSGFSARRLCLNTPHRPIPGTHKHRSEPGGGEEGAYAPDDIPAVPLQPRVAPGTYRAILEAFAAECFISIGDDFIWREP